MNKLQFWALNALALVLAALLLGHYFLGRYNDQVTQALSREQAAANSTRQVGNVFDQLVKRVALGSDTDPRLKNILIKYRLNVTLDVDGKQKNYP